MVYAVSAVLSQPKPDFGAAAAQLEAASDLAIQKDNYVALVLAQNALGAVYVQSGQLEKGIATLEATRNGNVLKDGKAVQLPGPFRAAGNLPFMKATLLEALARGYESAQQPDKAFQIWNELYLLSIGTGFKLAEAEATFKMAEIYKSQKNVPDALEVLWIVNSDFANPSRQPAPFSSSHLRGLII